MAEDQIRTARGNVPVHLERAERSQRASVPGDAATYLALLLLLTPLLGAVRLLVGREPPAAQAMTQVVEVPRLVYVEVPAPTVAPTVAPFEPTVGPTAEPVVLIPEVPAVQDSPETELEPGPTVVLPAATSVPRVAAVPAAPAPPRAAAGAGSVVLYVVAPGDTLFSLARRHGTSVETIRGLNGMRPESTLRTGQQLRIPTLAGTVHVVEPGQTLYGIARSYEVDPRVLASTNGLSSNLMVQAGQRLVVPKELADSTPIQTAVPTEEPTATPAPSAMATATPKPKQPAPTPTRTQTPRRR